MSFNPQLGDTVSRRYVITEMGAEPVDQLSEKEISYWIPIEEATLLRSTFEDTKELIRTWVCMRDQIELRGEIPAKLDALAKKLGY
jgi:hypothetical protein